MDYTSQILEILFNLFNLKNIIFILLIIIGGLIIIRLGDKTLSKIEQKFDLNLTAHYLFKDIWKYTVIIVANDFTEINIGKDKTTINFKNILTVNNE